MVNISKQSYKAVPSPKGLEHLRVMERAATYPNSAVWELHERYGDVFAFGFGAIRFHWFIGAEALAFILTQPERFAMKRAYSFLQPIVGDSALITSDEPMHLKRRRLVQPAFHGKRVRTWLEQVETELHSFYETQPTTFDLYGAIRPFMLKTISRMLLGQSLFKEKPSLLKDIASLMDFANLPFLAQQFKLPLPGTPWYRFVNTRAKVEKHLLEEITLKRSRAERSDTMLDMLLDADDAYSLSNIELKDQALSLVSAGFDTTSAALSWAVFLLLENSEVLANLKQEMMDCSSFEEALKQPLLDAVVKETLRLYPTAPAGLREAREDLVYKEYFIPKGSLVAYGIYITQRQETYFKNALSFKPERWINGFKPEPFSYLPFGHGVRYCIGGALATSLIKLHLYFLLKHYTPLAAWTEDIQETGNTVHPKGGLPIKLVSD